MKKATAALPALALLLFAAGTGSVTAMELRMPQTFGPAVVYDENADPALADYSGIVAGIERTSDIVVYPIALQSGAETAQAMHAARAARSGSEGAPIAVLYPDIGEPYRSVFASIIDGVEDRAKGRVLAYAVRANQNGAELVGELRRQGIHAVIALGRNGLKAAGGLDRDIGVVVGGVVSAPESEVRGMVVHSLAPDPVLLFDRLKGMMPAVRRVFVIYDARQNGWLIRLAREAARNQGLELVAEDASDLKTAMRFYHDVVAIADPRRDALWLPQDTVTVEESAVLPVVLQEAWIRGLAVFSSSVAHVKRGALFALYPDNAELGRHLAASAIGHLAGGGGPARGVVPLRDVLTAVNLRTASHLGLGAAHRQLSFDMVYPDQ